MSRKFCFDNSFQDEVFDSQDNRPEEPKKCLKCYPKSESKMAAGNRDLRKFSSVDLSSPPPVDFEPDKLIKSPLVAGLTSANYQTFLKSYDVALVLFYDPNDKNSKKTHQQIKQAATNTRQARRAYGAVNCLVEKEICRSQKVAEMPYFRLFSRGEMTGTIMAAHTFDAAAIKGFIEEAHFMR